MVCDRIKRIILTKPEFNTTNWKYSKNRTRKAKNKTYMLEQQAGFQV